MELKICSELKSLPLIKAGEINDLQGSLKDLSEVNFNKLLKRIEAKGFKYPLYLYFDKQRKAWNLDGNQRLRVIKKVWGDEVELPFVEVYAPNIKAAKLELLAISSEYGTVTKDGFDEFSGEFEEIDFEEVFNETAFDEWMDEGNPTDEDWLNMFNKETHGRPDEIKQITFILKIEEIKKLLEYLKQFDKNKDKALSLLITKWDL